MRNLLGIKSFLFEFTWLLASAALFFGPPARAQEEDPLAELKKLEDRFEEALNKEDYKKALEIGEQMHYITLQKHTSTLFNIARVHDKLGDKDVAFAWLESAAETSYWHVRFMLRDSDDFKSIRNEKRFKEMMKGAWLKSYIWMLERPERVAFQKPVEVMAALALRPGERVADIGAGSGYFTIPFAKAVGPDGRVWATDLYQELLDHIAERVKEEGLDNVECLKAEKDGPMLPKGGVDTIVMVDTYHYLENRVAYNGKLRECLAPGGRVVVIDSKPRPPEERMPGYPQPHVEISLETLDAEMAEAGFKPVKVHDFLPEQYFVEYGVR